MGTSLRGAPQRMAILAVADLKSLLPSACFFSAAVAMAALGPQGCGGNGRPDVGSGGAPAGVGSGGGPAGVGGAGVGSGGTSTGSGGSNAGPGGSPGTGGSGVGAGGSSAGTGGSPAGTGGSPGSGGMSPGSGGTSARPDASSTGSGGGSVIDAAALGDSGMPRVYGQENTGADCPKPALPAYAQLPTIDGLPDPFVSASGNRITSRADWRCRRAEISAMVQNYELGTKPAPPSNLTASFAANTLTVNVTAGSGSLQLTANVTLPSGAGPFPAVIGVATGGTAALPANIFTSRGIATVAFADGQVAPQFPNRGQGAFYGLYPDPKVGSMIAWAWGISRIIDGLEKTVSQTKIDLTHLAVTGCSYAGKIALYAGAFDERIALTIPEESGGGGEAAWRVSGTMTGTEDLSHAQGTAWYWQDLTQFNATPGKLPFDQHEVAAMVAPRALLMIGNPDIAYLASEAGYVSAKAAIEVYKALGVPDRIGFTQVGGHAHCAFPAGQTADVSAFVDKFLVGKDANTSVAVSPYSTDLSKWFTWSTPQLQ